MVSRALPVPLVPPAQALLRAIEVTPVYLVSLELRVKKENPVFLEALAALVVLG